MKETICYLTLLLVTFCLIISDPKNGVNVRADVLKTDCAAGKLSPDDQKCGMENEVILFSDCNGISRAVEVNPKEFGTPLMLAENLKNVAGLNFDYDTKELYVTQTANPMGLAEDSTQGKFYLIDSSKESIFSRNKDGSDLVLIARVGRAQTIALDTCNGMAYYTVWGKYGTSGQIVSMTMGGSQKRVVIDNLLHPSSLIIDYEEEKLYWDDRGRRIIERSRMDGTEREVVPSTLPHPSVKAVSREYIYLTDFEHGGLYRADKHTGANMITIVEPAKNCPIRKVLVINESRQQCSSNFCNDNNGGCTHSCHPGPNGKTECKSVISERSQRKPIVSVLSFDPESLKKSRETISASDLMPDKSDDEVQVTQKVITNDDAILTSGKQEPYR